MQLTAPSEAANFPSAHCAHSIDFSSDANMPGGQASQALFALLAGANLPATQASHTLLPVDAAKCPELQSLQLAPLSEALPTAHSTHAVRYACSMNGGGWGE